VVVGKPERKSRLQQKRGVEQQRESVEEKERKVKKTKTVSPFYDKTGDKLVFEGEHSDQPKGTEQFNSWKQEIKEADEEVDKLVKKMGEEEAWREINRRMRRAGEGIEARSFGLKEIGINDEFEDRVPETAGTKPPFTSWNAGEVLGVDKETEKRGKEPIITAWKRMKELESTLHRQEWGKGAAGRKTGWRSAIAVEVCCGEGGVTSTALRRAIPFGQPVDKRMGEDQDISRPEVIQAILEEVDGSGATTVIYEPDCTPYNKGYTLENARKNHPENWKEVLRKRMDAWDATFCPFLEQFADKKEKLGKEGREIHLMMEQSGKTTLLQEGWQGSKRMRAIAKRLNIVVIHFDQCKWVRRERQKATVWFTTSDRSYFWEFTRCDCWSHVTSLRIKPVQRHC
jgi:hypothetical protein